MSAALAALIQEINFLRAVIVSLGLVDAVLVFLVVALLIEIRNTTRPRALGTKARFFGLRPRKHGGA